MVKSKVYTQFELPKNDKTDNSHLMIEQHIAQIKAERHTQGFKDESVAPAVPIDNKFVLLPLSSATSILTVHDIDI
jgi:hypothetical protein